MRCHVFVHVLGAHFLSCGVAYGKMATGLALHPCAFVLVVWLGFVRGDNRTGTGRWALRDPVYSPAQSICRHGWPFPRQSSWNRILCAFMEWSHDHPEDCVRLSSGEPFKLLSLCS